MRDIGRDTKKGVSVGEVGESQDNGKWRRLVLGGTRNGKVNINYPLEFLT